MRQIAVAFALAAAVMSMTTASALAKPNVKLQLSGVLVTTSADGHEVTTPLDKVTPRKGETYRYTIVAENAGDEPAVHLVAQDKIPNGTSFVADSASKLPGVAVDYSIDGGKTWSAQPMVTVQTPKGLQRRPADASAYTTIRFIASKVAPRSALTFTYEVRVK